MRRLVTVIVAAMLDRVRSKWKCNGKICWWRPLPYIGVMDLEEFLSEWKKEIEETNRPATGIKSRSGEPSTYYFILNSAPFSIM